MWWCKDRQSVAMPSCGSRLRAQLCAEHVACGKRNPLALRPAVRAALDIEHRILVQPVRCVPGSEIDLVMHQPLRAEDAHREDAGRGPARPYVAHLAVRELEQSHRLVVHLRPDRGKLGGDRAHLGYLAAEEMQHV